MPFCSRTLALLVVGLTPTVASADPPIVITLTADFLNQGNNESAVDIANDAVTRQITTQGVSTWTSGATFATVRANTALQVHGGRLYLMGGESQALDPQGDIQVSTIAADGSLGAWSTLTQTLPTPNFKEGTVVYGDLLYLLGGCENGDTPCTTDIANNYFASFDASGALNAWQATTAFPTGYSGFGVLAFNNALYTFGGYIVGTGYTNQILRAPIKTDGSLGAWNAIGTIPVALAWEGVVLAGEQVVMMGGCADAGGFSTSWTAHIHADTGLLDAWQAGPALPTTRCQFGTVFLEGSVYVVAGWSGGGTSYQTVLRSSVATDGTLSSWVTDATMLPGIRDSVFAASYGNHLYTAGGDSATINFTDTTFVGTLTTTASPDLLLESRYSQRVDLGAFTDALQVTVNGSATAAGTVDFAYRAGQSDGTYGPLIDLGDVTLGQTVPLTADSVGSLWYTLVLKNGSAAEALRDVTDVTFSAVPPPDAGIPLPDAGTTPDAGVAPPPDAGTIHSTEHLQVSWGCDASPDLAPWLCLLAAMLRRRPQASSTFR